MNEEACVVTVTRESAILKTLGGNFRRTYNAPASWSVDLDNSGGLYGYSSAVADVRGSQTTRHNITVAYDGVSTSTPNLYVEDWEYDTDVVTISGRCGLSKLDRDDQYYDWDGEGLATAEDTTVANILNLFLSAYGMTQSGAPGTLVTQYNLVGNPLRWLTDLLSPTYVFYMGSGNNIIITPSTTHTSSVTLSAADNLEVLRIRKTTEIRNKATVERIVPLAGRVVLAEAARSGGDTAGVQELYFSEPSRNFRFDVKKGYRGAIHSVVLKSGESIVSGLAEYSNASYVATEPVDNITFVYEPAATASESGPWTPNYTIVITGYPTTVDVPPLTGYSETAIAGSGDRPYPEPFSSVAIGDSAAAAAAAAALVEKGTRLGSFLNASTRLKPSMAQPNQSILLFDSYSGFSGSAIVESAGFSWSEDSDTGTIFYDCTIIGA